MKFVLHQVELYLGNLLCPALINQSWIIRLMLYSQLSVLWPSSVVLFYVNIEIQVPDQCLLIPSDLHKVYSMSAFRADLYKSWIIASKQVWPSTGLETMSQNFQWVVFVYWITYLPPAPQIMLISYNPILKNVTLLSSKVFADIMKLRWNC